MMISVPLLISAIVAVAAFLTFALRVLVLIWKAASTSASESAKTNQILVGHVEKIEENKRNIADLQSITNNHEKRITILELPSI